MRRFLASRGFMSVAAVSVIVAIAAAGYVVLTGAAKPMRAYCAMMPDAAGLYLGSHVTMLGIPVGSVTRIEPSGDRVRVDFRIEADHPLRGEVSAVTLSDTLVADRNLALVSAAKPAAEWDSGRCVTRALTPKSMTQTMDALSKLATELSAPDDPARQSTLSGGVSALGTAVSGTGDALNELLFKLGDALKSPDAAIGRIGELIDAITTLSAVLKNNWGELEHMLTRLGSMLEQANTEVIPPFVGIIDALRVVLPWFNDITTTFGRPLLNAVHATVPLIRWAGANVSTLEQLVDMVPTLTEAFRTSVDPATGQTALAYTGPKAALAQPDADQTCAAINAALPGRCRSAEHGLADIDLVPLVLAIAGAK
ncbi:virulence factor Mce family protein [Nocardia amikacinitolerans]|uniref:MlaD family protein n=1 Tax=Nocardia amikacinitolerans TaxID=756689 RepID=UPI0008326DC6|nr:MlaD family protein [Nocardia amikacinitolerans]MCP2315991.1 virulence factor Mce family protein [Nocardia amikacinitolerans]